MSSWRRKSLEQSGGALPIKLGHSRAVDARSAVAELHAAIGGPDAGLVLFFCSSHYELSIIGAEVNRLFAGATVVGCTTAGEIGPAGYLTHSLSGLSFPAPTSRAVVSHLEGLQHLEDEALVDWAASLCRRLEPEAADRHTLGVLLIDGLSGREERVARACQRALGDAPLVGGSAGDDLRFSATHVFSDGAFRPDSAALVLLRTEIPFAVLQAQHFLRGPERLVVTAADAPRRIVQELNGRPAALEYARAIGRRPEELSDDVFTATPLVVRIDGVDYVRSIRSRGADGSLTLYCAIDRGVVLRLGQSGDLLASRRRLLDEARQKLGELEAVLAFDCIHCSLETRRSGLRPALEAQLIENRVVGFNTYGEQLMGVHMNQTLTGVAFGRHHG